MLKIYKNKSNFQRMKINVMTPLQKKLLNSKSKNNLEWNSLITKESTLSTTTTSIVETKKLFILLCSLSQFLSNLQLNNLLKKLMILSLNFFSVVLLCIWRKDFLRSIWIKQKNQPLRISQLTLLLINLYVMVQTSPFLTLFYVMTLPVN